VIDFADEGLRTDTCDVCGGRLPEPQLDLGLQPLCDDLIPIGQDRENNRYPIRISICPICLTAHQRFNVRKELLFPKSYHYRPRFTQDVLQGMKQLVEESECRLGSLAGKIVCDVGCSDGSLLNYFRESGAKTCGIEPTDAAKEANAAGHFVIGDYFSCDSARKLTIEVGQPDIITFTNVFAHIEDLKEALAALKILAKPGTAIVIENHYLGSVLDSNQFDTFYHEHPRTYSLRSFRFIARALSGKVAAVSFPKRYGGNIRVFITDLSGSAQQNFETEIVDAPDETEFSDRLAGLQKLVRSWHDKTRSQLSELSVSGVQICGKSFPGRAAILINLLGLDCNQHPHIFEKPGSLKVGHYVPGTRIPIVSDERWISGEESPQALLIWSWHIAPEVTSYLRERGYTGRIFKPLPTLTEI
jgi:hypothetical protein